MNPLRPVAAVVSWIADRMAPVKPRPVPGFWDREQTLIRPRVITNRGLGEAEQDAQWVDADGDVWRYNATGWEYSCRSAGPWLWAGTAPNGHTSVNYAPYHELTQQLQTHP